VTRLKKSVFIFFCVLEIDIGKEQNGNIGSGLENTKLCIQIFNIINDISDSVDLQQCLDNFYEWFLQNDLSINKCNVISFSRSRSPYTFSHSINSIPLLFVSQTKDLGVIFSSDLSFDSHIDFICRKDTKILGFINRILLQGSQMFTRLMHFISCWYVQF